MLEQPLTETGTEVVSLSDRRADDARDLVKAIAMDIGKEVCAYVEVMYPDVWAAGNSGFKLSLRNVIYNEIMAAVQVSDEGKIHVRLKHRASFRRWWTGAWRKMRKHTQL